MSSDSVLRTAKKNQNIRISEKLPMLRADFNQDIQRELRMGFDHNIDALDDNGKVITGTLTTQFPGLLGPGSSMGTHIGLKDVLTINRGNTIFAGNNMGKSLTLNGTTQYVYHADTDELDMGTDDFMFCGWVKVNNNLNNMGLVVKWGATDGFIYRINDSGRQKLYLNNSSSNVNGTAQTPVGTGWAFVTVIGDRSGNAYFFLNGVYDGVFAISSKSASLNNVANFNIGYDGTYYLNGKLDEFRLYRFGTNGLYVSGTVGTNGVIRVGSASGNLIWSDTDSENLIKRLYYSPYSTLTSLGYSSINDANRTERATNGTFDSNVTGWTVSANTTITWDSTDIAGNTAHAELQVSATTNGFTRMTTQYSYTDIEYWEIKADIYIPSGQTLTAVRLGMLNQVDSGIGGYVETSTTDAWTAINVIIRTDGTQTAITPYVQMRNSVSSDLIYIDNISMKRIGEVARWKFDSDLTDESSNSLDLTGVNTPTYSDNTYINPLMYNSINPHTGTISFWITPDWDGDDGENHYVFFNRYNSTNYIVIYKATNNYIYFKNLYNNNYVQCSYDLSSWVIGESHHITMVWSVHTIDGTDTMQLYIDGSEVNSSSTVFDIPAGVEENMDFGQYDEAYQIDGIITGFQISHIPYKDTITNAEAAGMSETMSVEYLYNSGSGNIPIPHEYVGCQHVFDTTHKLLQHPAVWTAPLAANASNTTFELSTAHATKLENYRLAMGGEVRILIYKPATYNSPTPYYETILVDSTHTAGVFTVAAMTNEAQYTTALSAAVAINLAADPHMEWYGTEAFTNVNLTALCKSIQSNSGKQSLFLVGSASGTRAIQSLTTGTNESFYLNISCKELQHSMEARVYNGAVAVEFFTLLFGTGAWERQSACWDTGTYNGIAYYLYANGAGDYGYFDGASILNQMITNPGFEATSSNDEEVTNGTFASNVTGWSFGNYGGGTGSLTWNASGYADLTLTVGGTNEQLRQDNINLAAGTYVLTFNSWASTNGLTIKYIQIYKSGASVTFATGLTTLTTSSQNFSYIVTIPTATADSNTLIFYLQDSTTGSWYFDNISIKEFNFIPSNATLELDSSNEKSGTFCGKVTATAAGGYVYQTITVVNNTWYTAVFHGKAASGDTIKFQVMGVTTGTTYYDSGNITSTSYKEKRCLFYTDGDTSITLRGVCVNNTDIGYFDDWSMVPLIEQAFSTETPSAEDEHYAEARW